VNNVKTRNYTSKRVNPRTKYNPQRFTQKNAASIGWNLYNNDSGNNARNKTMKLSRRAFMINHFNNKQLAALNAGQEVPVTPLHNKTMKTPRRQFMMTRFHRNSTMTPPDGEQESSKTIPFSYYKTRKYKPIRGANENERIVYGNEKKQYLFSLKKIKPTNKNVNRQYTTESDSTETEQASSSSTTEEVPLLPPDVESPETLSSTNIDEERPVTPIEDVGQIPSPI
jgi:hypothetical protein